MFRSPYKLSLLAILVIFLLGLCGMKPITIDGVLGLVYLVSLMLIMVGGIAALWRMLVTNARRIEAANINESASPERVFGYRWQKSLAVFMYSIFAMMALPLVGIYPLLWAVAPTVAKHPAMPIAAVFLFVMGLVPYILGRRYWSGGATIYPDRLAVRGIYSNGSVKWNEATRFFHEELQYGQGIKMWVYFLCDLTHSVRVEASLKKPEEFVRVVMAKTGLRLEERPLGWTPESEPVKHKHEAFRK